MKTKKPTYNGLMILTFGLTMVPLYLALFGFMDPGLATLIALPASLGFVGVMVAQN